MIITCIREGCNTRFEQGTSQKRLCDIHKRYPKQYRKPYDDVKAIIKKYSNDPIHQCISLGLFVRNNTAIKGRRKDGVWVI